jgi:hypothetical protein
MSKISLMEYHYLNILQLEGYLVSTQSILNIRYMLKKD